MARKPGNLQGWTARELREYPPRSKSLILTIFGGLAAPACAGDLALGT